MSRRRVFKLAHVRSDGWFERLRQDSPQFDRLSEVIGERVLAFSIVSGVQISSMTVNSRSLDQSVVGFVSGEDPDEHQLPLGEFRRRLVAGLASQTADSSELGRAPSSQELALYIGVREVYLAPLFGVLLLELHVGGKEPPEVALDLGEGEERLPLSTLRDLIRDGILAEAEGTEPAFSIDLSVLASAREAARDGDWPEVMSLLSSWPAPLAGFLRSAEGQGLEPELRAQVASALGLLGTAYLRRGHLEMAEEVLRLGIQWSQDNAAEGDIFGRLGEACVARGRYGEAIGILRRALALGASEAESLPLLARCFADRGLHVAAMVTAERALAAGAEADSIDDFIEISREALGSRWENFRELVPAPVAKG